MSNSVTTAIRGSLRETEIGRSRNTDKADRATVEQVKLNCSKKDESYVLSSVSAMC